MDKLKMIIAFAFMLGTSSLAWGLIPPPPVNQNMGIPDTVFNFLNANVCVNCHGGNPPTGVPVNPAYNPDRHHLRVGQPIDGIPDFPPYRDADGDGILDTTFACTNCHAILFDPITGMQELDPSFRDCLTCHIAENDTTVHHATARAQDGNCFQCHGSVVQGIDVLTETGKRPDPVNPGQTIPVDIPTYQTSLVTPFRSGKPNADFSIVSSAGTSPGNCNFCHNTGDGSPNATPEPFNLRDGTSVMIGIFRNMDNHHGTGFFGEGKCSWCHDVFTPSATSIRVCERCHDRLTIHNIEFDAVGDGTQPGQELPYFGHIGNPDNCWGCHGNNSDIQPLATTSSVSSAIVPTLISLSTQSIQNGTDVLVTATGVSFVNTAVINGQEYTFTSEVQLTDSQGNVTILQPTTIDSNQLEVIIPGTMAANTYALQIKKAFQYSNPFGFVITESLTAYDGYIYTPYGALVVVTGKGFTNSLDMVDVMGSGTSIVNQDGLRAAKVYIWNDDLIVAHFYENPTSVTVTNIFGTLDVPLRIFQ